MARDLCHARAVNVTVRFTPKAVASRVYDVENTGFYISCGPLKR